YTKSNWKLNLQSLKILEMEKRIALEMLLREGCFRNSSERGNMKLDTCPTTNHVERYSELPKPEIRKFDGNPMEYWIFMIKFQKVVEQATADDAICLNYLIQFCIGKARDSIEHCTIMNGTDGFNYIVSRAFIDEIIDGPPVKNYGSAALADLSQKMRTCVVTLKQLGYKFDLNASRTLEANVSRSPSNLRFKWAETAVEYMKQGREPTFEDLARFIEERVDIMCTRYGKLAVNLKSDKRVRNVVSCQPSSTKRNLFTLQYSPSSQRYERYLVCICPTLLSLEVDTRSDLIKEKRLCRLCVKANYVANDCRLRRGCTVEGCGGSHHRLLHVTTDVSLSNTNVTTNYVSKSRVKNAESKVAVAVVPAILRSRDRTVETLAFLDGGSDSTLVLKDIVDDLKLPMEYARVRIETMNGYSKMWTKAVKLEVISYEFDKLVRIKRAYAVPSFPKTKLVVPEENQLRQRQHLQRIDLRRCENKGIRLLVVCNVPEAHRILEQSLGKPEEPYAIKSIFGWTLMGPLGTHVTSHIKFNNLGLSEIESTLERFYRQGLLEESQSKDKGLSIEDRTALRIMEKSITLKDCHYCISLPWKDSQLAWTDNKSYCLHHLARRYAAAMKDYLIKRYAEIARPLNDKSNMWHLPHHPVVHPAKPEKIRILFDCAAKHEGRSLNDRLLSSPDLTNSLLGVILRFRLEKVAIMADIEAMFHQVKVPEHDRDALRFLWSTNGDFTNSPEEFRMTVHLFGATSSPSCATFFLNRTIEDNKENYDKEVYDMTTHTFYVDDCLIIERYVIKGGFNLTKWVTNDSTLAQLLPELNCIVPCVQIGHDDHTTCRALGISWSICDDTFRFYVGIVNELATRRNILSFVAFIFDPIGYLAPVILPEKLILQKLCKMKLSWDDLVVGEELKVWRKWQGNLTHIEKIALPRSLNAAESAGYHLVLRQQSIKKCRLIFAKAKLAPIRATSTPYLELAAAMTVTILKTIYWTDSLVVLHSINNASKRFHTLFANRLVYIHEQTRPSDWCYRKLKRWLSGPTFLLQGDVQQEQHQHTNVCSYVNYMLSDDDSYPTENQPTFLNRSEAVNSWRKLQRMMAWLVLYKHSLMNKSTNRQHPTKECFNDVCKLFNHISRVTSQKQVDRTIKAALCLPFEVRHPIILPHNHFITRLIIRHYHETNGYMGVTYLISSVNERYWIIKCTKTIKSVFNNCYKCRKWFSQPCQQAMAPIPEDHFMHHYNPFTVTDVDYFGPLFVKRGRT
ncbi:Gag-Pol polyprotein, partial [Schistosoma japonicum]